MNVRDRRLLRSTLVVVGIALCLAGPARLASIGASSSNDIVGAVVKAPVVRDTDHATAPREPISLLGRWFLTLGRGSSAPLVAPALTWMLVVSERRRLTVRPLAASWRRRGPPALLG